MRIEMFEYIHIMIVCNLYIIATHVFQMPSNSRNRHNKIYVCKKGMSLNV